MSNQKRTRAGKVKSTWEECKPKEKRFVEAFLGDAAGDPVRAAELAQFGSPSEVGARLYRRLQQVIDTKLVEREASAIITTKGILTRLSTLADQAGRDSDKLKALELLARINGMLNDKVQVELAPGTLMKELRAVRADLAQATPKELPKLSSSSPASLEPLDAELVPTEMPNASDAKGGVGTSGTVAPEEAEQALGTPLEAPSEP